MKNNLLTDPLIRVRLTEGVEEMRALPSLYVSLAKDEVADFPALRPHQRHAWHAFLAQLATIALDQADLTYAPPSAQEWESTLRNLTQGFSADEPWCLTVEDANCPAFLQPPAPDGLGIYKRIVKAPDDLDILVTSKNHDVKQSIATLGGRDDWIFALVSLQTMAGFLGAGNYGIARMNGGFSSRPCLGLAPTEGYAGAHLFSDVRRMLADREKLLERTKPYFRRRNGLKLLWLEPWNGTDSLDLRKLDPYFIEICRRVRLIGDGDSLLAKTAATKKARIYAKDAKGNLGDFWTPISAEESKALSLPASGFNYKRLSNLLFEKSEFILPAAMKVDPEIKASWRVVARAVASGQGKTEGYHERTDIRFAPPTARSLFGGAGRDQLAELARQQIEEIDAVCRALRIAIAVAASGGKTFDKLGKTDRERATNYVRRLEADADTRFFEVLEKRFLAKDEEENQGFQGGICTPIGRFGAATPAGVH